MRPGAPLPVAAALPAPAGTASAHIDVLPASVTRGEAVEFAVRVPVERGVAMTRVRLEVPEQVTVFSLAEPPPGWTLTAIRGADGRVKPWTGPPEDGAVWLGVIAIAIAALALLAVGGLWSTRPARLRGDEEPRP